MARLFRKQLFGTIPICAGKKSFEIKQLRQSEATLKPLSHTQTSSESFDPSSSATRAKMMKKKIEDRSERCNFVPLNVGGICPIKLKHTRRSHSVSPSANDKSYVFSENTSACKKFVFNERNFWISF